MNTASTLASDDFCARQAHLLTRWQPPSLTPKAILTRAVEQGMMSEGEAGEAASDEAMRLCTETTIDTPETNVLAVAEHIAALAELVAWVVRGEGGSWVRPEPVSLPGGSPWLSGAFLSQSGRSLRHIALVDRWDAWRELEMKNAWAYAGECAAYSIPIDVIVVAIGSMRGGRWVSPWTTGWRHPVAKVLRFKKRDGGGFGGDWDTVLRETDKSDKKDWLDAMTEDGVLAETLNVLRVEIPERREEMLELAERKIKRVEGGIPDPQVSRCFDRMRPCPLRSECPQGHLPSEARGFVRLGVLPSHGQHGRD